MTETKSKLVENYLTKPEMHRQWVDRYRSSDNDGFFQDAFDELVAILKPGPDATILDVGCGSGAQSVRLASRGLRVRAVDFSESALQLAEQKIKAQGLSDRITLGRENILSLSFPNESFDYVLCWGVMMHIPDVGRAVSELSRIVRPGGVLVISEANMWSPEAIVWRGLKRILGGGGAAGKWTPEGVEFWKTSGKDALVTRQANISWLKRSFEANGMNVMRRMAGQFSEAYGMAPARFIKGFIHQLNNFWFRYVGLPQLAYGNILFLQKRK